MAHTFSWLALLIAMSLMSGCADFGRVPPAQSMKSIEQYDMGGLIRGTPQGPDIAEQWWHAFADPPLEQLMTDTLADAPTLAVARERVNASLASIDAERANSLPQLSIGFSLEPTRFSGSYKIPKPAAGHWQTDTQLLANLSWNLDVAGRITASVRAATFRADEQKALAQGVRVALQTAIVTTYLQLARDTELRRIAGDALAQHRALLKLTDRRVAAGLDMRMASLRAAEPIPLAQAALARDDAGIVALRDRLALLVGRGPGYSAQITPTSTLLDKQALRFAALPAELIARRADVAAAKARVQAEAAQIDVARAAFYPNINLLAFAGWQSLGLRALLHGNSASLGVGPALTLPIFEGGRLRANLKGQIATYNTAVAEYDECVVQALAQVSDTLASIAAAIAQRGYADDALERASLAFSIETRRYEKGLAGYLDVLLAQQRLTAARAASVEARASSLIAQVQLIGALGGAPPIQSEEIK
ncbi:efflux transporter outer membrane subunit [Trinickia sp. LjRoot230]|uniref:efflux transporter outer membrane subunit n=1 Tax=Trinickia sp. LjRoot230 TaxID=3342288 RepID=UPI003ECDD457